MYRLFLSIALVMRDDVIIAWLVTVLRFSQLGPEYDTQINAPR